MTNRGDYPYGGDPASSNPVTKGFRAVLDKLGADQGPSSGTRADYPYGGDPASTNPVTKGFRAVLDLLDSGGGGTDVGLGVTNAAVGQIIKVKTVDVDGKPTSWESVDEQAVDPSSSDPLMDGTASAGSSSDYARGDHVHPTDTSRAPAGLGITGASVGQVPTVSAVDADGKPTAWAATSVRYSLIVTCATQDGVTVTDQTVTVRANGPDGPMFGLKAYNGQPVSFALPVGFVYFVSVSNNLADHFNPTVAVGVIVDADVAVTLTYSDFSNIQTAADIKDALDNDIDLTELVGSQITCLRGSDTLTWDVVSYDSVNKVIWLLLHDVPWSLQFEPKQALFWAKDGMAAGDYSFKHANVDYYFTLVTAIPAGGQLTVTDALDAFTTYTSTESTVALETGAISTTAIANAIAIGVTGTDSGLLPLNHMDRVKYGSNNGAESALLQWFKSSDSANTPVPRINKLSRPCSYNQAGFLAGLEQAFLDCIADTEWPCIANNTYEAPASVGGVCVKGQQYTVTQKFWLASEVEIFGTGGADGSTQFDLFVGAEATDRIKYRGTSAQGWWRRTPSTGYAHSERIVNASGGSHYSSANNAYGDVPACRIEKSAA